MGALSITFLLALMLYIVRMFNVCVPAEQVPWCSPISKILFLNLFIKVFLVLCVTVDRSGQLALIEVLALFFM